MKNFAFFLSFVFVLSFYCPVLSESEEGITDKEILIGVILDADGSSSVPGIEYVKGMKCYMDYVNKNGGINGRKIKLIIKDDDYEPNKTFSALTELIEKDKVLALCNIVGTPTNSIIKPLINSKKIPVIGPITGDESFRLSTERYYFPVRGSYPTEAYKIVDYLVKEMKLTKISIMYQDDKFGLSGVRAVMKRLKEYNLELCSKAKYDRGKNMTDEDFNIIKESAPEAVLLMAVGMPALDYLKKAQAANFKPVTAGFSPVFIGKDTNKMIEEINSMCDGFIISQVTPNLDADTKPRFMNVYLSEIQNYGKPNPSSYEGFINLRVLCWGLEECKENITRETLVKSLEGIGPGKIGSGMELSYGENLRDGARRTFLAKIIKNKLVWINDAAFIK